MDRENLSCGDGKSDSVEVLVRIIGNILVKMRICHIADLIHHHQGITIGRRLCGPSQSDVAALAWHVLDVILRSEVFGQLLCKQAGNRIGLPTRREWNNYPHRPRWV